MRARFWRKWHRWIGFPAAIFLVFAAVTGVLVAVTEFFGEEERLREATRNLVGPTPTGGDFHEPHRFGSYPTTTFPFLNARSDVRARRS
jgi:hypothetical protein